MRQVHKQSLLIASLLIATAAGFGGWLWLNRPGSDASVTSSTQSSPEPAQSASQAIAPPSVGFNKKKYSFDEPGSIWWIVNKKRPLTDGYVPPDLVTPNVKLNPNKSSEENKVRQIAASAFQSLFQDAAKAGFDLMLASGYRSFALQTTYYKGYVAASGQAAADRFSAKPGTSEHQTGLSADISRSDRHCYLDTCFGDTDEGKWLAKHAPDHGFIIRYPENKEAVTGYMYEPWHIRYVGVELAQELLRTGQTPEEFFGLTD